VAVAHIGIGSNLGDRRGNCEAAIRFMEEAGVSITRRSSMIETEPWGVKEQPPFINMAVRAETSLQPRDLLDLLKEIEERMGRTPSTVWGPRLIDLDILFYDDIIFSSADLAIPHPLLHKRPFVLRPLAEISPDLVHPIQIGRASCRERV